MHIYYCIIYNIVHILYTDILYINIYLYAHKYLDLYLLLLFSIYFIPIFLFSNLFLIGQIVLILFFSCFGSYALNFVSFSDNL